MGKKVLINEYQLALLVNHIKEGTEPLKLTEENILEEGFKELAIAGLIALASIGGVKAQDAGKLTQQDIEAAKAVQNKLNSGDLDGDGTKDLKQYFKQAQIDLNQANLDKLMKAKVDKDDVKRFTTKSVSNAKSKLNQGYTLGDVKITRDTIWKDIPQPTKMDSAVSLKFDSNVFTTADFKLNENVASELDYLVQKIKILGGDIISINIEASTDKEPIKMGNQKLSELRANSIKDYLSSLGLDTSKVKIVTKPEQGPDLYSKTMSPEEREKARKDTEPFRYVKVDIEFEHDIPAPIQGKKVSEVIQRVQFELIKVKPDYGKPVRVRRKGFPTTTKNFKCKIKTPKHGPGLTDCFEFTN